MPHQIVIRITAFDFIVNIYIHIHNKIKKKTIICLFISFFYYCVGFERWRPTPLGSQDGHSIHEATEDQIPARKNKVYLNIMISLPPSVHVATKVQ